jgi:hypothetical protein
MRIVLVLLVSMLSTAAFANKGEQGFVWGQVTSVQVNMPGDRNKSNYSRELGDSCIVYVEAPFPFRGPNGQVKELERLYGFITVGKDCADQRTTLNDYVKSETAVVIPRDSYSDLNLSTSAARERLEDFKNIEPSAYYVKIDNLDSLNKAEPKDATVLAKIAPSKTGAVAGQCVVYLEVKGKVVTNWAVTMTEANCASLSEKQSVKINIPSLATINDYEKLKALALKTSGLTGAQRSATSGRKFFYLQLQAGKTL